MKAYQISMWVVLMILAVPVVMAMGFYGAIVGGEGAFGVDDLVGRALEDWTSWIPAAVPVLGAALAARFAGLHLPAGAALYVVMFTVTNIPLVGLVDAIFDVIATEAAIGFPVAMMTTLVLTPVHIVFVFGFIQLASGSAKGGMY